MSKSLFNTFESISEKAWKQKIQADLKGADYNDTLVWNSIEGIDVKPIYHADSFEETQTISNTKATAWNICQSIYVANVKKSNQKAIDAIRRGAESLKFTIPTQDISLIELLNNIDLSNTPIHFKLEFLSVEFAKQLVAISAKAGIHIHTDIIGNLAKSGNWYANLQEDYKAFEAIVNKTSAFSIDVLLYQNAGATIIQQLAYTLAHTNEYLNHLNNIETKPEQPLQITFNVSVGSNYFFEIAKLRALRILWKTLASEYFDTIKDCNIVVTPSKRNKTLYDYNTNMLRTTTECMSAILGGANTICNLPYDAIYHKVNEFGDRISRNQLLVLKHESYFDKVNNPAYGTYYI
jgi:methylmalonyl-CoA mutase